MLKKYGLMDSEEKPELTVKFMKYACKALQWAEKDDEVNNVLHLNIYRKQISPLRPFHPHLFGFENLWWDMQAVVTIDYLVTCRASAEN